MVDGFQKSINSDLKLHTKCSALRHTLRSTSFRLGTLRFRRYTPHPRITGIIRKMARLAISPNFFRYAPETSDNPNVKSNFFLC